MAREVNVDVASHSPQVDPILDELADMLSDITPMAPEVPYYSATSFDPREQPYCDADYWVDNLRHTVRFSAAVQTALEDGFRVFGELAPHPLLIRAIDQTAGTLDITVAALAGMRRGQEVPNGLGDFLGDLYAAGAQVDFSVLYPVGRLVDAPLPTWTHRSLVLVADGVDHGTRGAHLVAAHPLLGSHVRLLEEPERHAWAAEVGTAAHPWLVDHQINNVAALPGAAYCEMALAAARTVFGDDGEVRDVKFERMLLLKDETPVSAVASADGSGVLDFVVETDLDGERERRASAALHAGEAGEQPQTYDMDVLRDAHPNRADGDGVRQWFDGRGVQFGPAFTALLAVNAADETADTVLAEIGLPTSIRNQQTSYGVHPALLDACFQSVAAHPGVQASGTGGLLLPLGVDRLRVHGATRNARYCLTRVTSLDGSSVEADIDLLDDYGTVLFTVQGLRMGSGMSEDNEGDRVLNERLLGIEWRQHQVAEITHTTSATWLVVNTSDAADLLASALTDALKLNDADVTTMSWPQQADHAANAERLGSFFTEGGFDNVVVVSAARNGCPEEQLPHRGGEQVRHLVRIARELADVAGEPPRLYVITRNAQTVLADDRPNLEQAGLRGLLRVVGAEYPQLRPSQIDVDDERRLQAAGPGAAERFGGRRDRLPQRRVVHRAPVPEPAAARRALHHGRRPFPRRHAPGDPYPGRHAEPGAGCLRPHPAGTGSDRGRGHRVQPELRRRPARLRSLPELRGSAPAAGHRLRRCGHRGRSAGHLAPGGRPRGRHVAQRLLGHVRDLRRRRGRDAARWPA